MSSEENVIDNISLGICRNCLKLKPLNNYIGGVYCSKECGFEYYQRIFLITNSTIDDIFYNYANKINNEIFKSIISTPIINNENNTSIININLTYSDDKYKPSYQTSNATCADLFIKDSHTIKPNERKMIPTGITLNDLDFNYSLRIYGRSSTLYKEGILVYPGIVDPDYKGEIFINVLNLTQETKILNDQSRIAQIELFKNEKISDFNIIDRKRKISGNTDTTDIIVEKKNTKKRNINQKKDL